MYNQHHKNLTGGSPKQSNIAGSFCHPIKKNDYRSVINIAFISDIVLHMVAILTLIKIIADVGDILSDNELFGDIFDTPNEGTEQHKKRKKLKSVTDKDKAHLLGPKWTHGRMVKASNEIIKKKNVRRIQAARTEQKGEKN